MKKSKILNVALAGTLMLTTFSGCSDPSPTDKTDPSLKLSDTKNELTLENDRIRIVFNKTNGSVREIYNKEEELYFVKDVDDAQAVSLKVLGQTQLKTISPENNSFEYTVETDTKEEKTFAFSWDFENGAKATATVSLKGFDDEIVFTSSLKGLEGDTVSLQYPIVESVSGMTENGDEEYLVSSMATGYLFQNPVKNFFRYGQDLSGQSAAYPSGFGSTMQFMGYYAEDKGGFYVQTKDEGDTIKDFTFKNAGGSLTMEVGHYVPDLGISSKNFGYETVISNLYEGNWYEAAEKYRDWALKTPWSRANGKNDGRTDLNKDLYENAVLANFIVPSKSTQSYAAALYEKIRSNITTPSSKILTIPYYYSIPQEVSPTDNVEAYFNTHKNTEFYQAIARNGEPVAHFEYTDLHREAKMSGLPKWITDARMKNAQGGYYDIMFAENWQYICAGSTQWRTMVTDRQQEQFTALGAQGIYNDLGICAVHPLNCYDANHEHGTRINVLQDYHALMQTSWEISRRNVVDENGNCGFTGQEMISEQVLPYVDFYQARSASGEMGGMEHDAIMKLVQNDVAIKIPLFEYVYHEYAGVRGDGFTLPIASIGVPYYHAMAYVALNGGIPEFNYECLSASAFTTLVNDLDVDMIRFVDTLGKARLTYGKEYLVYGKMTRVPDLGVAKEEFTYETPIVINWGNNGGLKRGEMMLDPVVASAFESDGKIAIFLCNITGEEKQVSFTLDANNLYGKAEGSVSLVNDGGTKQNLASLADGKAEVSIDLSARSVYMITVE